VSATRKWISELKFSYNICIVKENFVSSLNGILKIYGSLLKMLEIGMGRYPIHCVVGAATLLHVSCSGGVIMWHIVPAADER
jgi:hypothetical protein